MNFRVVTAADFRNAVGRDPGPATPPEDGRVHVPLERVWARARRACKRKGIAWNHHVVPEVGPV